MKCTVLVDGGALPQWKYECIVALRERHDIAVVTGSTETKRSFVERALGGRMLRPATLAGTSAALSQSDVLLDLRACAPRASDVAQGQSYWYFCDGNGRALGALPGAPEIANGSRTFTLQLRQHARRATATLRTGTFKLLYSYGRSLEIALGECIRWPAMALDAPAPHVATEEREPDFQAAPRLNAVAFAGHVTRALLTHMYTHLFLDARWEVGLIAASPADFLNDGFAPDIRWLGGTSGFFADPFVVTMTNRQYVLGERLDDETRNGFIGCVELGANGRVLNESQVMKTSTHLSYPYVFEHEGAWYMVPESAQAGRSTLYRAVDAPFRWEPFATLVDGVGSCDSTLVRHADRWWLFCTHPSRDANLNLFLYHAPDLRGPWVPHKANPVKTDIRSARPAGTPFVAGGALYRPAQNCVRSYGDAIVFNRITALDENAFNEEAAATFERASAGARSGGVHTMSYSNGTVAIDSKTVIRAKAGLVRRRLTELMSRARGFAA